MAELKSYVCPNCGANTTNVQNCEYCGSLLVRFVEKGIDLSHTSYLNNNEVFPGLIEELKRNLKLQEENPNDIVVTDVFKPFSRKGGISITNSDVCPEKASTPECHAVKKQLCIIIGFSTYSNPEKVNNFNDQFEYNKKRMAEQNKFRQLHSFSLFTSYNSSYIDEAGWSRRETSYAINFGEDAEGAARLVSEILIKVKGWSLNDRFEMFTKVGNDPQYKRVVQGYSGDPRDTIHGFAVASDSQQTSSFGIDSNLLQIIGWAVAIIIIVLSFVGC